ncbi:LLM class flavin-dependent oxidoreductase [Streptomyces sp. SL13]|uniref:LLM class flavin-dependent oxidoreductase n=1 Tax=Streptantibioticus silvisoli TaxID=2705255 RepID=A0AA90JY81_9ACTN|nr:MupA/Atu3671 family FMN-dependent luciferase-like monooxygenase [Streptantibioticus silvisoli]MDI5961141.1 LLM class flavin-dependent oxidoreductase [Streptantibioticus silvisoli]MDI5970946.1 LLM class flavin-dependent oxidoreductase [Streptantibioticus silvisoli]
MDLSIMFFGAEDVADHTAKYADVLAIARAADELGFTAVWTPERHFQDVGQAFPSPPVLGAAIAAVTRRIAVRAGSVVLPLHHPLRVVEDWSVLDNLSGGGRVGLSAAAGWHSADFVLAPDHYADRRQRVLDDITTIRRLWAGEAVELVDGTGGVVPVRPQPRPASPYLPIWLTSSGSPESWTTAARLRTGLLGATVGQDPDRLAERIGHYRQEYAAAPEQPGTGGRGTVTLMAHTYVGESDAQARRCVAEPLKRYLRTHVRQSASNRAGERGRTVAALSEADVTTMTEFAFERYLSWGSLIGSPGTCAKALAGLREMGCDEVTCFVDFGLERHDVLASLGRLAELKEQVAA